MTTSERLKNSCSRRWQSSWTRCAKTTAVGLTLALLALSGCGKPYAAPSGETLPLPANSKAVLPDGTVYLIQTDSIAVPFWLWEQLLMP